jgi:hypothetical protein
MTKSLISVPFKNKCFAQSSGLELLSLNEILHQASKSDIFTEDKLLHPSKADSPIEIILLEIVTEDKPLQPLKA